MLVKGAVQQEVFDCLNCDALAAWADQCVRLADSKEVLVEANVSCLELEENRCLTSVEVRN